MTMLAAVHVIDFDDLERYTSPAHITSITSITFMADLDMDPAGVPLDLSIAPFDIITMVLETMCDKDRFTCALDLFKDWTGNSSSSNTQCQPLAAFPADVQLLEELAPEAWTPASSVTAVRVQQSSPDFPALCTAAKPGAEC